MNITEEKAYHWLEEQGYKDIIFSARRTPDFITASGERFEVKKVRSNTIWFSQGQLDKLEEFPETTILVFNEGAQPVAHFKFSEISSGQEYWRNIHIGGWKGKNQLLVIKVSPEEKAQLIEKAEGLGLSMSAFVLLLVKLWSRDKVSKL